VDDTVDGLGRNVSRRAASKTPEVAGLDTLSAPERLLLFCAASGTDPAKAGITSRTIEVMIIKGLTRRGHSGLVLSQLGYATLDALLGGRGR
jgi:hypothetical protein